MNLQSVKVIIFDLDYTLLDSSEGIVYCFNRARSRAGEPEVSPDKIKERIGIPIEQTFELYGSKEPLARRDEFRRVAREGAMAERSFLLPGVRDTIPALGSKGFRLAVASTKSGPEIQAILTRLEILSFFEEVAGADQVENAKPEPDSLLFLLDKMKLSPQEAVYVGDHIVDVRAARSANMGIIAIKGGPVSDDDLAMESPDALLNNVSEILDLL